METLASLQRDAEAPSRIRSTENSPLPVVHTQTSVRCATVEFFFRSFFFYHHIPIYEYNNGVPFVDFSPIGNTIIM